MQDLSVLISLKDQFTSKLNTSKKALQNYRKEIINSKYTLEKFGTAAGKAGKKMTVGVTVPVVAAGTAMVKTASDYEENLNKIDSVFGKSSKAIKSWSDNAINNFGLSKNQALDMASQFGDMGTSMGLSKDKASDMSMSLSGLAGDLASFKNVSVDVAKTGLNGIFTGETESLKGLGVVMTQTNLKEFARRKGITKSIDSMTQAEKVQLRYNFVLNKTKNAQGDYKKTSDGTANSMRTFKGSVENLGISFGQTLLPVVTKGINGLTKLIKKVDEMSPSTKKIIMNIVKVVAVMGPALLILGKMITISLKFNKAVSAVRKLSKAGMLIPKVMGLIASPAGILIGVIAALVVVGVLLYKNWDKIKEKASQLKKAITKTLNAAGFDTKKFSKSIKSMVTTASKYIKVLKKAFGKVVDFMKPIVKFLVGVLKVQFKVVFSAIIVFLGAFIKSVQGIVKGVITTFGGIVDFISGVFTGNWKKAWTGVKEIFSGIFGTFVSIAKAPLNAIIGLFNSVIKGANKLDIKIPKWVPGVGGKKFGINIPTIPMLAKGTDNWKGGIVQVNEKGGEIIDLPKGSRVYPHDESVKMAKNSGTKVINISKLADYFVVREEADIDKIAKALVDEMKTTEAI